MFFFILACGGGNGPTDPPSGHPFTISGTVVNSSGNPIPSETRVLSIWFVASGTPDYEYVFGEGAIDPSGTHFTLTLEHSPPAEALNDNGLAVGYIVLVADASLHQGDRLPADFQPAGSIVGGSEQYAVVYIKETPVAHGFPWVTNFERGYTVGHAIQQPGEYFVGFEPAADNATEAVIDDWANLTFPNWT